MEIKCGEPLTADALRYIAHNHFPAFGMLCGVPICISEEHGWDAPRTLDQFNWYMTALARQGKPRPMRIVLTRAAATDLQRDCESMGR